jgi:hypothetical protein
MVSLILLTVVHEGRGRHLDIWLDDGRAPFPSIGVDFLQSDHPVHRRRGATDEPSCACPTPPAVHF